MTLPLLAAACASTPEPRLGSGGHYKLGRPYQIGGKWYHPRDERDYAETGVASWYGPGFHGRLTANGERFDENGVSAAHRTLPLPSHLEVTNLDNGRRLVVRVNDRGPYAHDRILDLSRRAAQLLGMEQRGTARVRLKRVYPRTEPHHVASLNTTDLSPAPPASVYVQIAALSDLLRAQTLAADLERFGTAAVAADGGLYRVRIGPFNDAGAAARTLAELKGAGYSDARIVNAAPAA